MDEEALSLRCLNLYNYIMYLVPVPMTTSNMTMVCWYGIDYPGADHEKGYQIIYLNY